MGDMNESTARLIAEVAGSFGLSSVEGWRWIKEVESPAVAMLRADGRRFIARIFVDGSDLPRATYISELAVYLESTGVDVEAIVRTTSGGPFAHLTTGGSVILSPFYQDPPVPIPFDDEDARAWGRYVARIHAACRVWRPTVGLPSPWLGPDPSAVLDRARAITGSLPMAFSILEDASERIARCWDGTPAIQPVHGDLWPGNLLKGSRGLRAIDLAEVGDGPCVIDLATAFRWMPWRTDSPVASRLWGSWLTGYSEVGEPSRAELDSIPPVACLQHLIWMIREAGSSRERSATDWYVEDHCFAIQALVSATVLTRQGR